MNLAVDSARGQPSAEDAALARIVRREAGLLGVNAVNKSQLDSSFRALEGV